MPSPTELTGKKILLVDFTISGDGLKLTNRHLKEWSKQHNVNLDYRQFAIDLLDDDSTPTKKTISLYDNYKIIAEKFTLKKYGPFSKFEQFNVALEDINTDPKKYIPPQENPAYQTLKANLRKIQVLYNISLRKCLKNIYIDVTP